MSSFQHIAPPLRLFSGADSLAALSRELDRLKCHRALIFSGSTMAKEGSVLATVRAALGTRCVGVFSGVRAHSPLPAVEDGAREIGRHNADAAIALGGGSAIVTARASSILVAESRDARALATSQDATGKVISPKLLAPKIPQFVVPTTPTTAMVRAGSAVLDPVAKRRLALFDPKTRAHAIFLHPEVLRSAPRALIVSSGINTFAMAMEGLSSRAGDPLSDAFLIHALRLIAQHLPAKGDHGTDDARNELALAAVMCGRGTEHTGLGIPSALGHAIGARCGIENGLANAIVLPHALRFNGDSAASGLDKIATALGCEPSMDGVCEALAATFGRLGIPLRLRDADVPRDALPEIAANAMSDWFLRGNPRTVRSADELAQLLDDAW
jgi:alcohol dehydrogenase